jgi:endoglucanase
MDQTKTALLHNILSQPSAPFREELVANTIDKILTDAEIPHFRDPIGNIIVGAESKAAYLEKLKEETQEPLRIFIAHMDHPGFHGTHWKNDHQLEIKWHGGSPKQFLEGAKVWIADEHGWHTEGTLTEVQASDRAIETATVELPAQEENRPKAASLFGGFRFRAPTWEENGLLYTKAADDSIGVFTIISLALDMAERIKRGKAPFLGLITRAEEVGFIGAIGHFELGWLNDRTRPIICVSLECSRTLPGAEIGKGPVVRLGDRFTIFSPGPTHVLCTLAAETLPDRHQKRIMDGGTCEATAATVYGYPTIALSMPLGNYHNESFQGGPDSSGENGPAPEFVSLADLDGLLELTHALMKPKIHWDNPWQDKKSSFKKALKNYQNLLQPI